MTRTELKIIEKLNEYAKAGQPMEDFFVPEEVAEGVCVIPTPAYATIMDDEEDAMAQSYNGPEIETFIQMEEEEIIAVADCLVELEENELALVREYADRLEFEADDILSVEETEEGVRLSCYGGFAGEEEDWKEQLLASFEDEDLLTEYYDTLVYSVCYRLMDHILSIRDILSGELSVSDAVSMARLTAEDDDDDDDYDEEDDFADLKD